jgi:uncharacterized membrane protein
MKLLNIIKQNYLLILILLVAVLLRFHNLDFQSPWLDEALTLKETNPNISFNDFKENIILREGIAHFYFLIIRTLNDIFTYSSFTARFFSATIGVLSVYSIFCLGRTLFNKNVGLISAILLSINWFAISYSQEARPYILLMFFIIISIIKLIDFIKKPNYKNAILFGVINGLIIHVHMIGLISIFSQYVLLLFIFIILDKAQKANFFICGLITFFTTLLVASPTYKMFLKVTEYKSGWLQLPDKSGFTTIFNQFFGDNEILIFIFSIIIIFYCINLFNQKQIKIEADTIIDNKIIFSGLILFSCFFLPIIIPIIKSYTSEPMILNRYFIAILPALIIVVAIGVEQIKNNIVKILIITIIVSFSIVDLFLIKDYYSKVTKTQFREISNLVVKSNHNQNDKIVSTFGWVLGYFLEQNKTSQITIESTFTNYIFTLKNKSEPLESFWYMNGNSLPYNLSNEEEQFLNEKFTLKESFEKHDTWARHYISKNPPIKDSYSDINIRNFTPSNFDSKGNLMIFENSIINSPVIDLKKGNYKLTINGNSLPNPSINGENAHLIIRINGEVINSFYLSEKTDNSIKTIEFESKTDKKAKLLIIFDNDISTNKTDRNVLIYSIKLEKI